MEALGQYDDDDVEEEEAVQEEEPKITLTAGETMVETEQWETLVTNNVAGFLTRESFKDVTDVGDVVAFHNRLLLSDGWRRTFVVLGDECVHLFDEHGALCDETDTPGGCQSLPEFLDEWGLEYYEVPVVNNHASFDESETLESIVAVGKRIKIFLGTPGVPGAWYGGKVFADPDNKDSNESILVAYDDGELSLFKMDYLAQLLKAKNLAVAHKDEGGIIAGEDGESKAEDLMYYHRGKGSKGAVGVLIGESEHRLSTEPIFEGQSLRAGHSRRSKERQAPHSDRGHLPLPPLPQSRMKGVGIPSEKATTSSASTVAVPAILACVMERALRRASSESHEK